MGFKVLIWIKVDKDGNLIKNPIYIILSPFSFLFPFFPFIFLKSIFFLSLSLSLLADLTKNPNPSR